MSYDLRLEKEILVYIRDWPLDGNGPGGDAIIDPPDVYTNFPRLESPSPDQRELNYRVFDAHLNIMIGRGWIEKEEYTAKLTPLGFDRIDWHGDRSWFARSGQISTWLAERIFSSIFLPMIVAIMTFYVNEYITTRMRSAETNGGVEAPSSTR